MNSLQRIITKASARIDESATRYRKVDASVGDVTFETALPRGLYVGTGGNLEIVGLDGVAEVFRNVPDGSYWGFACKGVLADGTTAGDIIAVF